MRLILIFCALLITTPVQAGLISSIVTGAVAGGIAADEVKNTVATDNKLKPCYIIFLNHNGMESYINVNSILSIEYERFYGTIITTSVQRYASIESVHDLISRINRYCSK